jgi:hypothetical protein
MPGSPAQHKLDVPVAVVNHLIEIGFKSKSEKLQASCDMSTIAFYIFVATLSWPRLALQSMIHDVTVEHDLT